MSRGDDSASVLIALRWWARPSGSFYGRRSWRGEALTYVESAMRGMRAGRLEEIRGAGSSLRRRLIGHDWSLEEEGLPPPETIRADASTWAGAVDGVSLAARLVTVSRFGDALQYLADAERLAGHERPAAQAVVQAAKGCCLRLLGDGEAAEREAGAALELIRAEGSPQLEAEAMLQRVRASGAHRDEVGIPTDLEKAWGIFERVEDEAGQADCLLEQSQRQARAREWEKAAWSARQAWDLVDEQWSALACEAAVAWVAAAAECSRAGDVHRLAKDLEGQAFLLDDPWWAWQLHLAVAEALLDEGKLRRGRKRLAASLDALDALRFRVGDETQRAGWLLRRSRPFSLALDQAVREDDPVQVLRLIERVRRSRLSQLLLARATQADRRLSQSSSRLLAEKSSEGIDELRRRNALLASLVEPDAAIDPLEVLGSGQHPQDTRFLALLEGEEGSLWRCWGVGSEVTGADRLTLPARARTTLERLTDTDSGRLALWIESSASRAEVAALGDVLLPAALLDGCDGARLILIVAGRLARVPYPALHHAELDLVHRANLSVTPSLGLLGALGRESPVPPTTGWLLMCPEPGSLPGARAQVERLAEIWPDSHLAFEGAATVQRITRLSDLNGLAAARGMVVAAHGSAHPFDPMRSGIQLSDGSVLSAGAVLGLRLPASVELWSCSSAGEPPVTGEEMPGLMASCLASGARSVLGALWPLSDADARDLSISMHERLATGMSYAQALGATAREATVSMPMASWASLVLSGIGDQEDT